VSQPTLDLDIPEPAPKKAHHAPSDKVRWARYKVKAPVHCDDCVLEIHQQWPRDTHAPNRASWKRTAGDQVTYACFEHTRVQKALDGVNDKKRK
jgi:hypothetical protein